LSLSLLLPIAAHAQGAEGGLAPLPADATLLHLSATGSVSATPDRLQADLLARAASSDPAAAQDAVNAAIARATRNAAAVAGVTARAGGYGVERDDPEGGRTRPSSSRWSAHETLHLEAADAGALLGLAGRLQADGLLLEALAWTLSPARAADAQARATSAALAALRRDADTAARALGLHVVRMREVRLDAGAFSRSCA